MVVRPWSFLVLLALSACEDPLFPSPAPARRVLLEAGSYELRVVGVQSVDCDGATPRDFIGKVLPAELALSSRNAFLSVDGLVLHGDMSGGDLYVEGSVEPEPPVMEDDREPGEPGGDGDADVPPDSGSTGSGSSGSGGATEPGPRPDAPFASLDAAIRDPHFAEGAMRVSAPRCEVDLDVALAFVEGGDRPIAVEETTEPDEPTEPPARGSEDEDGDVASDAG
jgi:hypothetical protein